MVSGAVRHRLAQRVVASADGPMEYLSVYQPSYVAELVLQADSQLTSHLVDPRRVVEHAAEFLRAYDEAPRTRYGNVPEPLRDADIRARQRVELLGLVESYRELKRELDGSNRRPDGGRRPARIAGPRGGGRVEVPVQVVLLDEYQDTSTAQARLLHSLFGGGHPVTRSGTRTRRSTDGGRRRPTS